MKNSFGKLILLFTIVPFVVLFLLLKLAEYTSAMTTFLVIVITGVVGAFFARNEGRRVLASIQREIQLGRIPGDHLIHGLCVLVGGILLLTPGLLTDAFGFALLFPVTRTLFVLAIKKQFSGLVQQEAVKMYSFTSPHSYGQAEEIFEDEHQDKL
jgi:UPF0716 protein FxsA